MAKQPQPITPQQMRAARSLLGWSRERLAARSDTAAPFVSIYENDGRVANLRSREPLFDGLATIRATLEAAGVTFTNGDEPGVKLKKVEGPHLD